MNRFALLFTASMNIVTIGGATVTMTGCTPAQQAVLIQIENVVLADLAANKTLEQIETDVAAIVLPGNAGADIVAIVNDAIQFLIDTGVIAKLVAAKSMPAQALDQTKAMLTTLAAKHAQNLKR